jgi:hypothetical protein
MRMLHEKGFMKGARLFQTRRSAAVTTVTATSLIAAALFVLSAAHARAEVSSGACGDSEVAVLPAPAAPWKGEPLRVVIVSEKPLQGELSLTAPDGSVAAKSRDRQGGPPYFWYAEVAAPVAGTWHATLASAGCGAITRDIAVRDAAPPRPPAAQGAVWTARVAWNRGMENLYSAWIQKLFDGPLDVDLSWPALHDVLRDRSRNLLFNYLNAGEDDVAMPLRPDCADFVYFLRAYFSFKMGLPFGYANCSRGGGGQPPRG